jgi:hypothetical protein
MDDFLTVYAAFFNISESVIPQQRWKPQLKQQPNKEV